MAAKPVRPELGGSVRVRVHGRVVPSEVGRRILPGGEAPSWTIVAPDHLSLDEGWVVAEGVLDGRTPAVTATARSGEWATNGWIFNSSYIDLVHNRVQLNFDEIDGRLIELVRAAWGGRVIAHGIVEVLEGSVGDLPSSGGGPDEIPIATRRRGGYQHGGAWSVHASLRRRRRLSVRCRGNQDDAGVATRNTSVARSGACGRR